MVTWLFKNFAVCRDAARREGLSATAELLVLLHHDHFQDITTPLLEVICHPWASTSCVQPVYQIWSCYFRPLRRYEKPYSTCNFLFVYVCDQEAQ